MMVTLVNIVIAPHASSDSKMRDLNWDTVWKQGKGEVRKGAVSAVESKVPT